MPIDFSILREQQPVDIAGNFATGYKVGEAMVNRFHQSNALAALAQNPDDNAALTTLYQTNPDLAASLEQRRMTRQKFAEQQAALARRSALGTQYAGGDTTGAEKAAVSQGDFDVAAQFSKLDDQQQKAAAAFWDKAGPIAYQLQQTKDPAQRQALWAQAKPILLSEGVDTNLVNKFDPTNDAQLNAAVTTAQKVSDLVAQNKPSVVPVVQGGGLYAVNPNGGFKVLVAPNTGEHPLGAPVQSPRTAVDAHGNRIQYNPQTKAWEPAGGAGGNASGGFQ